MRNAEGALWTLEDRPKDPAPRPSGAGQGGVKGSRIPVSAGARGKGANGEQGNVSIIRHSGPLS